VTLSVVGEADEVNQNFSFEAAMAKIPFDQVGISPVELKLVRGSRYSLVPISGMNKCVLNGHFGSFELGNPALDRQYWQILAEASTSIPADTSRPVIASAVRVTASYHMQF